MSVESVAGNPPKVKGPLIYRQSRWTRLTHWSWAICLFFLMGSGLQIFNAHPTLYFGKQSGFEFQNAVLDIGLGAEGNEDIGVTTVFGHMFNTTGVLGLSGASSLTQEDRAFPAWATIPSNRSLATGRIVHFFFAWTLLITLFIWLVAGLINGHVRRDLVPSVADIKNLPKDIADHARLRFHHTKEYNVLQKFAYGSVLFVMLPLMILTGLTMSPNFTSFFPFLLDLFGGRQTARTIHFGVMLLLVGFFVVHMLMILAAGPINELRSIITGWYRIDAQSKKEM